MEIRGDWDTKQVWIAGREVRPERSLRVRNHSPDGFSWGDGGNGPAQLALALLLEIATEEMALLWYQDVRSHIVAQLAQDDFVIDSHVVPWICFSLASGKELRALGATNRVIILFTSVRTEADRIGSS
jgi:Family of unknown function (DUF6166)